LPSSTHSLAVILSVAKDPCICSCRCSCRCSCVAVAVAVAVAVVVAVAVESPSRLPLPLPFLLSSPKGICFCRARPPTTQDNRHPVSRRCRYPKNAVKPANRKTPRRLQTLLRQLHPPSPGHSHLPLIPTHRHPTASRHYSLSSPLLCRHPPLLCRHPERSEGSLYFAVAVAVAFLLVIPEGGPHHSRQSSSRISPLSVPQKRCQAPKSQNPAPIQQNRVAYELPSTFYTEYSVRNEGAARLVPFLNRLHLLENKYFARNPFRLNILQPQPTRKPFK
jgi:hypothetical protein